MGFQEGYGVLLLPGVIERWNGEIRNVVGSAAARGEHPEARCPRSNRFPRAVDLDAPATGERDFKLLRPQGGEEEDVGSAGQVARSRHVLHPLRHEIAGGFAVDRDDDVAGLEAGAAGALHHPLPALQPKVEAGQLAGGAEPLIRERAVAVAELRHEGEGRKIEVAAAVRGGDLVQVRLVGLVEVEARDGLPVSEAALDAGIDFGRDPELVAGGDSGVGGSGRPKRD